MKRADIVAVARTWIGTPFVHQGRIKGLGCDCVGIPLCVAQELGADDKDGQPMTGKMYASYSPQPEGNYVHRMCQKHLVQKPVRQMKPGDVISMNVISAPCHVGILGDANGLTIIHAYSGASNKVVEQPMDVKWRRRIAGLAGCFAFPGVED
jgi:NlpC/P60 family putative phage cell wall peptidase